MQSYLIEFNKIFLINNNILFLNYFNYISLFLLSIFIIFFIFKIQKWYYFYKYLDNNIELIKTNSITKKTIIILKKKYNITSTFFLKDLITFKDFLDFLKLDSNLYKLIILLEIGTLNQTYTLYNNFPNNLDLKTGINNVLFKILNIYNIEFDLTESANYTKIIIEILWIAKENKNFIALIQTKNFINFLFLIGRIKFLKK